jgi:hypothetical protein
MMDIFLVPLSKWMAPAAACKAISPADSDNPFAVVFLAFING